MSNTISKPENPYYSNTDTTKLNVSDAEWKKILPPDLYAVAREADTERAFTGTMWNDETKGTYYCADTNAKEKLISKQEVAGIVTGKQIGRAHV